MSIQEFDVSFEDVTIPTNTDGDATSEYQCEECGVPLEYSGRGRKPKRCAEHRQSRSTSVPRTNWKANLTDQLHTTFTGVGVMVGMYDMFDGKCILEGSKPLADAFVTLAEQNKSVRRGLENFVNGAAWGNVILAVAAIAVPILDHHNLLPTSKLANKPASN